MIVVETMFFDSDDYDVNTDVIPCDSKETAKAVVKKVYDKLVSRYSFRDETERKEWEKENVKFKEDGSIYVSGGDCGYGSFDIVEKEPITADTISSFEPAVSSIY